MSKGSFVDRQTPAAGEIFLDHIGWYVPDLAAAGAAFERLGFVLTPPTRHTHENAAGELIPSGTANRCAMLKLGYLELLTHVPELDTSFANQLRAGLDRYGGLHLIAFTCADADIEAARMKGAGFEMLPVADLRRRVETDDGAEVTAAFSVLRLPPGVMAEGRIQMLTQDTPDAVWLDSLIARDNAIEALSGVVVCTADPEDAAARFSRFTGRAAVAQDGRLTLPLDRGSVWLLSPDQFGALIPGARVPSDPYIGAALMRSRDPAATASFLAARGVPFSTRDDGALIVDATEAMGAYLVIEGPR